MLTNPKRTLLVLIVILAALPLSSVLSRAEIGPRALPSPRSAGTAEEPTGGSLTSSSSFGFGSAGTPHASASPSNGTIQLLYMSMGENVSLTANGGGSPMVALTTVPAGPLAELYRKVFEASMVTGPNVPVPLVEHATTGENRSAFYRSMEQQQLFSLGLTAKISDSSLIPWTDQNGLNVWMRGSGFFMENVTPGAANDQWQVFVGPRGKNATNAAIENSLNALIFARLMLHSMGAQNIYEYDWNTRIYLPPGAILLNSAQVSSLAWNVDLGGGSYLQASVSEDHGAISLKEVTLLTEGNLTATPESLIASFSNYKNFEIDYSLPHTSSADPVDPTTPDFDTGVVGVDFTISANPDIRAFTIPQIQIAGSCLGDPSNGLCGSFTIGGKIQGSASLSLSPHFHLDICGLSVSCGFLKLKELDASIDISASANLQLELNIQGQLTGTLTQNLFDTTLFSADFQIGPVPVEVEVDLMADAKLQAVVTGGLVIDFGIAVSASYSAGIIFDGSQWASLPTTSSFSQTITGPTVKSGACLINASQSCSITASVPIKLALLLYDAVGGFVGFEPYATARVFFPSQFGGPSGTGDWQVTLGFKVNVGVLIKVAVLDAVSKFCGPCGTLLSFIQNFSVTVLNERLFTWSGSFLGVPPVSASSSSSSALVSSGGSVQLNGTVTDASGNPVSGSNVTVVILGPLCKPFNESLSRTPAFGLGNATLIFSHPIPFSIVPIICGALPRGPSFQTVTDPAGNYLFNVPSPTVAGDYNATFYVTPPGSSLACLCASVPLTVLAPDTTPPIIKPVLDPTPNAAGWVNGNLKNVTLTWNLSDPETGVATSTGCQGVLWYENNTVINETGATRITCTVSDRAGNTASMTVIVRIARLPPVITYSRLPGPNAQGWNNGSVTVTFTCLDALSGVSAPPSGPVVVSSEGSNQRAAANCTSVAGITGSLTVANINIDETPPAITGSASPGPNAYGWNNGDVTVSFACLDSLSGVLSTSNPTRLTGEGMGQSVAGTCTDNAGNSASTTVSGINIDKTPPQTGLSIGTPQFVSTATYVSESTPFTLTATDSLSGVLHSQYGIGDSSTPNLYNGPFVITSIGSHTVYYRSVDKAGNLEAVKSRTVIVSATKLTYSGDLTAQYSDPTILKATLTDVASQGPIAGQTVKLILGAQTVTATTDSNGLATASIVLNQAPSTYTLTVSFAGQNTLMPSSTSASFTITKEDALVSYTGDSVVASTSSSITLRATVQESADANGAGFGDLTKASVTFRIFSSSISQILLQTLGPFPVTLTSQPGVGVVVFSIPNLSENTYLVVVSMDPDTNSFYAAPTSDPVVLTVFTPSGTFVTGGGWIIDSSGSHGNFGFVVRYTSSGQVQGQFVYVYRSGGLLFMVKSNAWIGLAFDGNHAFFQGKATVQVVNATTGAVIANFANFQFRVDAWENSGTSTNGGVSVLQITVWDKNGLVYHQAGGNLMGGTIMVHKSS